MKVRSLISLITLCCLSSNILHANTSAAAAQRLKRRAASTPQSSRPTHSQNAFEEATQGNTSLTIRWKRQPGVNRYRLQVALDESFTDVVLDKAVMGIQAVVEVEPGKYFWRVAPAPNLEAGTYSRPQPLEVSAAIPKAAAPKVVAPKAVAQKTVPQKPVASTTAAQKTVAQKAVASKALAPKVDAPKAVASKEVAPKVVASGNVPSAIASNLIIAATDTGWRMATGEVARPVTAMLRPGKGFDIVAVSSDGLVRAVEGATGLSLWSSSFTPGARSGAARSAAPNFTPVVVGGSVGGPYVVVAYDGGLRALRGDTGREVWRTAHAGHPAGGYAADIDGDGKVEVMAAFETPHALVVLSGENGRTISNVKIESAVVGMPAAFANGEERGVMTGHTDGTLILRRASGEQIRATKLETSITTQPVVINTSRGSFIVVGSEKGLVALKADDFELMGIIITERDSPRGILTVSDTDGDGSSEIAFVTRAGKVALVSTLDGKVKWSAEGAADAASVALADLNADGVRDVLVAGGNVFAYGFSGRDGMLIWKAEEESAGHASAAGGATTPRTLIVAPLGAEGALVVGADPSRVNLRAIELPKGALKTAQR